MGTASFTLRQTGQSIAIRFSEVRKTPTGANERSNYAEASGCVSDLYDGDSGL
jgi:hypothetical protein